jgi:polysaccharide export outer membrane protein
MIAQADDNNDSVGSNTAVVEIRLPDGVESNITVEPGDRSVVLIIPRGAQFPLDFSASTSGLVRTGTVTPLSDGMVRLDLELSRGVIEKIAYRGNGLDLHLATRLSSILDPGVKLDNYVLGPNDLLRLTVHNQTDLNTELTVTREGTIMAPLLGEVNVRGMTPRQAAIYLADRLGRSYLVDPQVDLEVLEFRSQWVMVTGEALNRGRITLRGGTRLKEVVSEAGGFTPDAGETITISRKAKNSDEYEILRVDRAEFEHGESDPMLYHGDIVDVTRSEYAYIQGEVRSPGRIAIERGLTLMRAVALVGGLTEWADRKEVRVLYPQDDGSSLVETYNLRKIQLGKLADPALHGGETVIVERRFF